MIDLLEVDEEPKPSTVTSHCGVISTQQNCTRQTQSAYYLPAGNKTALSWFSRSESSTGPLQNLMTRRRRFNHLEQRHI
ncbi:hypothetical protein CHARACLAT_009001 [Characodon lateralis]|uniref:Uncharacterized protein n=1 Tax=Characodon lateralis TaxID=208331 RepID=A0ABU7DPM7_9TELE|nr:hypothetical protein [Characodon lateralis]